MKRILLLILISLSFICGQTDNLGSQAFNETAVQLFHGGYDKLFSDGTYLFKSFDDRTTVDTSGFYVTDTTAGAALGSRLLQGGEIITPSAADINLLATLADSGYTIVIDSTGWMVDVPRILYGWANDLTFSATDYNTVAWTSGYLIFANGDSIAVDAGNTGNISDLTYIFFDSDVSATALQTTTSAVSSVGLARVLIAVARPTVDTSKLAAFNVFGNNGFSLVVGTTQISDDAITTDLILANTILAGDIAANTITGNEIAVNTISTSEIIFANMSDSLFWSINSDADGLYINADKLKIGAATTFDAGYDIADFPFVIYGLNAPTTRDSGDPIQTNDMWIDSTAGQGNVPKIWTGSEWRTAFTYINGGYIKTGTIDADYIDVAGVITAGSIIVGGDNVSDLTNDAGYGTSDVVVVRQDAAPNVADYSPGDVWIDTHDGDRPYTLRDASPDVWVAMLTVIDGGSITTGTIDASSVTIQTASNGDRTELDGDGITFFSDDYTGGGGSAVFKDLDEDRYGVIGLWSESGSVESFAYYCDPGIYHEFSGGDVYIVQNLEVVKDIVAYDEVKIMELDAEGGGALAIEERSGTPTNEAGLGKFYVDNTTPCMPKYVDDSGLTYFLGLVQVRTSTGHQNNGFEGKFEINTVDLTLDVYADGAWRNIVSW